ncbi:MAG: hypothetical protein CSA55_05050 [Ilumatobacter coccineus]|uniref:Uncharacterized protein n=1 Tax=Ilumatobacter coccineus TaxID=467094 RepID=A0A2G6K7U6_9ACTN|nr:MAG: hypothetical protein CSA55_05050 [Ilumatobacter coccineus]
MTKTSEAGGAEQRKCRWCRRVLPERDGPGRKREFCSQACRQWEWVSRQRSAELSLSADDVIISRQELDDLHDDLYVLESALIDAESDKESWGSRPRVRDVMSTLDWVLNAARPLIGRQLSAPTGPGTKTS